jgi:hypothetical protein
VPYFCVYSRESEEMFLVGRLLFLIFVALLIEEITTFDHIPKDIANIPERLFLILVRTGLPGVSLTLTVGQLISENFAEEFTFQFLTLYGYRIVTRLSLFTEWIAKEKQNAFYSIELSLV